MEWLTRRISRRQRRAFTLAESMVACVILSLAVLGVCTQLAAGYQQNIALGQTTTAIALARQLMDEIVSKPLADPVSGLTTPASSALATARSTFTCVGNYNLYTDSTASLTNLSGAAVSVASGQSYTRSVTVSLSARPAFDATSPAADFAIVTVSVKTPGNQTIKLTRIKTNYTFSR